MVEANPYAGVISAEEILEKADEQFTKELETYASVKSVATVSDETLTEQKVSVFTAVAGSVSDSDPGLASLNPNLTTKLSWSLVVKLFLCSFSLLCWFSITGKSLCTSTLQCRYNVDAEVQGS